MIAPPLSLQVAFTNNGKFTWNRIKFEVTSNDCSILSGPGDGVVEINQEPGATMEPRGKSGDQVLALKSYGLLAEASIPPISANIAWKNEVSESFEVVMFARGEIVAVVLEQPYWFAFAGSEVDRTKRRSAPLDLTLPSGALVRIKPDVGENSLGLVVAIKDVE